MPPSLLKLPIKMASDGNIFLDLWFVLETISYNIYETIVNLFDRMFLQESDQINS